MAENLVVLFILGAALGVFYWQYRTHISLRRREQALDKKNSEMTCFVYGAAHDLKAPLRTITQASDRLYENLKGSLCEEDRDDFVLMQQRVRRMTVLIDDLLAYWQAGQSIDYTHNYLLNMNELVDEVVVLLAPHQEFIVNADPSLSLMRVHHMPMRQILINLIGNALKHHGRDSGVINISGVDEGQIYRFFIMDDGQGIPDAYKRKIFDPFEMLHSRDEVEGSGLGLSLVKRIIDRQKGEIYVADAPNGGAVFVFTWPKPQRD